MYEAKGNGNKEKMRGGRVPSPLTLTTQLVVVPFFPVIRVNWLVDWTYNTIEDDKREDFLFFHDKEDYNVTNKTKAGNRLLSEWGMRKKIGPLIQKALFP